LFCESENKLKGKQVFMLLLFFLFFIVRMKKIKEFFSKQQWLGKALLHAKCDHQRSVVT